MPKFADHDDYIAAAPPQFQPLLQELRAALAATLPDAEEIIKYDMPGFAIGDAIIAGYAAFKKQCGLYVVGPAIDAHRDDIAAEALKATKNGVAFSDRKPISMKLVQRIAKTARKVLEV